MLWWWVVTVGVFLFESQAGHILLPVRLLTIFMVLYDLVFNVKIIRISL